MSEHHGKILWTELMTRDLEGAKKFYAEICGWTYKTMEGMESMADSYILAHRSGDSADCEVAVCGLGDMDKMQLDKNLPPHWFSYIAVDDVDEATNRTRSGGGVVIRDPFDIERVGRIAIIQDSTGAAIGLITPEG